MLAQFDSPISWEEWETPFFEAVEKMRRLQIINAEYWLFDHLQKGKKILAEGAQGSMLDIDFGTYPFVTSSNTIAAGVCNGLGVAPAHIKDVYGITKAYCTRVGGGPFPTELTDETGDALRKAGSEFGATTGRPRRCGWMDLVALRYAVMLSGVNKLIITKADVLDGFDPLKAAVAYEMNDGTTTTMLPYDLCDAELKPVYKSFTGWEKSIALCKDYASLPESFKAYCSFVENELQTKIAFISNGTGRDQLITVA